MMTTITTTTYSFEILVDRIIEQDVQRINDDNAQKTHDLELGQEDNEEADISEVLIGEEDDI